MTFCAMKKAPIANAFVRSAIMPERVDVFYDGWGEHWHWGTLLETPTRAGRPSLLFEYTAEARKRGLELSAHALPLNGSRVQAGFPVHQMGLPGPAYDSLPDG